MITSDKLYWGYVDYNEKIHIKRYKNDRAIRNAQESGTTVGIFEPFYAKNITHAAYLILQKYREMRYFIKQDEEKDNTRENIILLNEGRG